MLEKLAERKRREAEAIRGRLKEDTTRVSDVELFAQAGDKIKVIKQKGGNNGN